MAGSTELDRVGGSERFSSEGLKTKASALFARDTCSVPWPGAAQPEAQVDAQPGGQGTAAVAWGPCPTTGPFPRAPSHCQGRGRWRLLSPAKTAAGVQSGPSARLQDSVTRPWTPQGPSPPAAPRDLTVSLRLPAGQRPSRVPTETPAAAQGALPPCPHSGTCDRHLGHSGACGAPGWPPPQVLLLGPGLLTPAPLLFYLETGPR